MAADSSVLLEVIVEGKNIKLVQRDIEELGSSINKSSKATEKDTKQKKKNKKATDELAAGSKNFNKGQKGVAGATANGTKAFSKQREAIGGGSSGLVGAYATLAANIFAATAAFGALQRAAQFQKLLDGFETIAATSGRTSSIVVQSLQDITDGALSAEQAASAAAAGINAGFSNIEIERLANVAKNAAVALGRNVPDAIDRLVRGTAKLEPEILDELGIFVRLDDAVEKYAVQLGKSASSLTQTERRQAFLNETISQGELKFNALQDAVTVDEYSKLAAAFDNLTKSGLGLISNVLSPIILLLANNSSALIGVLVLFGSTIASQVFPFLTQLGGKFEVAAEKAKKSAKDAKDAQKEFVNAAKSEITDNESLAKRGAFFDFQQKLAKGEKATKSEILGVEEKINESIKRKKKTIMEIETGQKVLNDKSQKNLDNHKEELEVLRKQRGAIKDLIDAEEGRTAAQQVQDRQKRRKKTETGVADRLGEIQTGGAFEGFSTAGKGFKEYKAELGDLKGELNDNLMKSELFGKVSAKLGKDKGALAGKVVKVTSALRLGSVGVRLFGAAVVNALPVIGQIIFAVGLLIQGLVSLYRRVYPTNEGLEQLGKISEGAKKKIEVLDDGMSNYEKTLRRQLVEEARLKEAREAGTGATEEQIEAQVQAQVAAERYRQEVKVLAGSLSEVDSAFTKASDAFKRNEEESNKLTKGFKKAVRIYKVVYVEGFKLLIDGLKFLAEGYINLGKAVGGFALDKIKAIGDGIAGFFGKIKDGLKTLQEGITGQFKQAWSVFTELFPNAASAIEETASSVTEFAGDVVDAGAAVVEGFAEAGKSVVEFIDEKQALDQAKGAGLSDLIENLKGISAQSPVAAAKVAKLGNLEDIFLEAFRSGMTVAEALDVVRARVTDLSTEATKLDNAFTDVKDSFTEFNTQTSKFKQKFDQKNPLTDLDNSARNAVNSLANLAKELEGNTEAGTTFADQVATLGIDFENFGLTQEEVADKGASAFGGLITALDNYNIAVKTSKDRTAELKAQLADLKVEFDAEKAVRDFSAKVAGLAKTGKFEVTVGDQLKVRLENIEAEKAYLQEKANIEKQLVAQQYAVLRAELMVAANLMGAGDALTMAAEKIANPESATASKAGDTATGSQNTGVAATLREGADLETTEGRRRVDLASQLESLEAAELAATTAIDTKTTEAVSRLQEAALEAQITQSEKIIAAAGQGDTSFERARNFGEAGGFEGIEKARVAGREAVELDAANKSAPLQSALEDSDAGRAQLEELGMTAEQVKEKLKEIEAAKLSALSSVDTTAFRAGIEAAGAQLQPMIDNLKSLGPEGELVAAIAEGGLQIADSFAVLGDKSATAADKIAAIGGMLNAIGNIAKAASDARIAGIDKEIDAEKKRDGKSKESLAKIKQLEAKKEAMKKKQFEQDKKMKMAQVVISTAAAIMQTLAQGGFFAIPLAIIMGIMGAAQLAIISGTSYQGGGGGSAGTSMPSKVSVGKRENTVDLAKSQSASGELGYMRGQMGTGGPNNFKPAFMGAQYRAMGGSTTGYVVGEQGPELFVPDTPGTIVPNSQAETEGVPLNATFNINTIDASGVAEVLSDQQGNIIGMLREAANSYGQPFLEEVDTSEYTPTAGAQLAGSGG